MPEVTLYHNPRCSKCRQTLDLLQQRGIEPDIVEYLQTPPNAEQLEHILELLQLQPRDLMRSGEHAYSELGLDDTSLTRAQLIAAMVDHPELIQRPIVIRDGRAIIGRPPERVLEIL